MLNDGDMVQTDSGTQMLPMGNVRDQNAEVHHESWSTDNGQQLYRISTLLTE